MKIVEAAILFTILSTTTWACQHCDVNCPTGDCLIYDISQQTLCFEMTEQPPKFGQCQWWANGLSSDTDYELLGGKIVAYKIKFDVNWSDWFVPGVNDMDCKYNTSPNTCRGKPSCNRSLRRYWSYFYDHTHTYIICKSQA